MRPSSLALLVALSLLSLRVNAAPAAPADEATLRELVTSYEQAVRSGDVSKSGIRKSLASGFSAVLPSGELIASYGELSRAENALRTMVGRGARYESADVTVDPGMEISGDLATLTGRTASKATAQAGRSLDFTTHWSAVARKEDGTWRLVRHQAVMDPATNPWHAAEPTGPGWAAVVISGLLGALAGAMIGFAAARVLAGRTNGPVARTTASNAPAPKARAWDKSAVDPVPPAIPHPPRPRKDAHGMRRQFPNPPRYRQPIRTSIRPRRISTNHAHSGPAKREKARLGKLSAEPGLPQDTPLAQAGISRTWPSSPPARPEVAPHPRHPDRLGGTGLPSPSAVGAHCHEPRPRLLVWSRTTRRTACTGGHFSDVTDLTACAPGGRAPPEAYADRFMVGRAFQARRRWARHCHQPVHVFWCGRERAGTPLEQAGISSDATDPHRLRARRSRPTFPHTPLAESCRQRRTRRHFPATASTSPRKGAVRLSTLRATVSGVPSATSAPPASPASGPMSSIQSASAATSRLCSMTTTVCPSSTSRCSTWMSRRTSCGCSPIVGSSIRYKLPRGTWF